MRAADKCAHRSKGARECFAGGSRALLVPARIAAPPQVRVGARLYSMFEAMHARTDQSQIAAARRRTMFAGALASLARRTTEESNFRFRERRIIEQRSL